MAATTLLLLHYCHHRQSVSYSDSGFFSIKDWQCEEGVLDCVDYGLWIMDWPVSLKYLYLQMVHCSNILCLFVCSDGRYCAWTLSVVCNYLLHCTPV